MQNDNSPGAILAPPDFYLTANLGESLQPSRQVVSLKEAIEFVTWSLSTVESIPGNILAQLKLEAIAKLCPQYSDAIRPMISTLAQSAPLPERSYTPTEIGSLLAEQLDLDKAISAIAINKKLVELGYQTSVERVNSKNKLVHYYYEPTAKGLKHGQVELSAYLSSGGGGTKPRTRWYIAIVAVLKREWEV